MKWLLRSVPLFALLCVGCTTNTIVNNYATDSTAPTITRFTPDTVWTLGTITIYGNHFGYAFDLLAFIDTAQVQGFMGGNDTMLVAEVPEGAQTGLIHITTINGVGTSEKPVTVEYTFHPHTINDTLPIGASFSIPGTGMNHYHGQLRLTVAGVVYPIDSVFANRIVSHVVANGFSGPIVISDSNGTYNGLGSLWITRPSSWNTLSQIWDNVSVTETHTRTGYVNGPSNTIDSTWTTTATYHQQHDVNVSGIPFERTQAGLYYALAVPILHITWDTVSQTASILYEPNSSSMTSTHTVDTVWYMNDGGLPAMLPVTNAIEFTLQNFYYTITEDSTDTQGLVNWQETTTTQLVSGSFDLILKP